MNAICFDARDGTAELGCWLARPHWSSGIVTEAADAIVRYGSERLSLR